MAVSNSPDNLSYDVIHQNNDHRNKKPCDHHATRFPLIYRNGTSFILGNFSHFLTLCHVNSDIYIYIYTRAYKEHTVRNNWIPSSKRWKVSNNWFANTTSSPIHSFFRCYETHTRASTAANHTFESSRAASVSQYTVLYIITVKRNPFSRLTS